MEQIKNSISVSDESEYLISNTIDFIIDKWSKIGFLEGEVLNKRNVAIAYECCAIYLLDKKNQKKRYEKTAIFPVIRRIFNKIENNIPIFEILNIVIDIIEDFSVKYFEIEPTFSNKKYHKDGRTIDQEAEFTCDYSDNFKIK
jgi:hypothetical protein